MIRNTFYLNANFKNQHLIRSETSFGHFIQILKSSKQTDSELKKRQIEMLLASFQDPGDIEKAIFNQDELAMELIYVALSPLIVSQNEILWALSTPVPNEILYHTRAFEKFVKSAVRINSKATITNDNIDIKAQYTQYIYRIILEKCYNLSLAVNETQYYTLFQPNTSLNKYFKVDVDTRFVEVAFDGDLPALSILDQTFDSIDGSPYKLLELLLPLDKFKLSGFTVITLQDSTTEYALELIRNAISSRENEHEIFKTITHHLKTLIGESGIELILSPIINLNGEYIIKSDSGIRRFISKSQLRQESTALDIQQMIKQFELRPVPIFYSAVNDNSVEVFPYLPQLKEAGIRTFVLLPLFHKGIVVGALEIYALTDILSLESLTAKLQLAAPMLAQLAKNSIDHYLNQINGVVRDYFTVLQPSVSWKFEQVASNYLLQKELGLENIQIETISFNNVYPLFGVIDIRNSTVFRNNALAIDLTYVLKETIVVLQLIDNHGNELTTRLIEVCEQWVYKVTLEVNTELEEQILKFLHKEVTPKLITSYSTIDHQVTIHIDHYLTTIMSDQQGALYFNRNKLERSIEKVNMLIGSFFVQAVDSLQALYPCYFESFRTDGLEYDCYVGQSIAPAKPFEIQIVDKFRAWQLKTMIQVAQQVRKLSNELDHFLEITQLIYIRSRPLDITFRRDERRFDVEGLHNIRYEVIKKRIDKIKLKDSFERLTQPGKIAIVYSSIEEVEPVLAHIHDLQSQRLLASQIEFLELEHLNDVSGLKAIRVSIVAEITQVI